MHDVSICGIPSSKGFLYEWMHEKKMNINGNQEKENCICWPFIKVLNERNETQFIYDQDQLSNWSVIYLLCTNVNNSPNYDCEVFFSYIWVTISHTKTYTLTCGQFNSVFIFLLHFWTNEKNKNKPMRMKKSNDKNISNANKRQSEIKPHTYWHKWRHTTE